MPFSMADVDLDQVYIVQKMKSISLTISKIVTLQVRIPEKNCMIPFYFCRGKRVFPSVSAGLTLETSLVLSLLIFASVSLILPMKILGTERRVQAALEMVGEDFSRYAYLKNVLEEGMDSAQTGADDFAKAFCAQLGAGIAEGYVESVVTGYVDTEALQQVTMKRSEILEDGEWMDLILDYEIRMPFPVLGLQSVSRTARCRRRAWIGQPGKDGEGESAGTEEDEMVYLGKKSTRYHKSRSCHYLVNNLTAAAVSEIETLRNNSGGRYHPCAVCASGVGIGNTVYIMPEGSSYHSRKNCTAIVAYVRMVPLSEAVHLGACSYCGR